MSDAILYTAGYQSSFVINRRLAEKLNCKDAALVLQFLIEVQREKGEEYHVETKIIEKECMVGEHKRRAIFKKLTELGILLIERRGAPCKNYFTVKTSFLETWFLVSTTQVYKTGKKPINTKGSKKEPSKPSNQETRKQDSVYMYNNNIYTEKGDEVKKSQDWNSSPISSQVKPEVVPHAYCPSYMPLDAPEMVENPKTNSKAKAPQKKKQKLAITDEIKITAEEVIKYLNNTANKDFRASSGLSLKLIAKRMGESYSVLDFKKVIDNKTRDWLTDPKMNQYLQPSTLFGEKFEGYLNASPVQKVDPLKLAFQKEGIVL